jgi:hypothetical protein
MSLFEELKRAGVSHTAAVSVGSQVRVPRIEVIIEGPRESEVEKGMWRGVLLDAPMEQIYCEQQLFLKLEDGREGKVQIMRVDPGRAYFKGIGPLAVPPSLEEQEEEILRILNDGRDQKA